jgi:hypothetical protein
MISPGARHRGEVSLTIPGSPWIRENTARDCLRNSNLLVLTMALPVHEIRIADLGQFDDADEGGQTKPIPELNTLDRAPDFDPRAGQTFIDDDQIDALNWDDGDEDEDDDFSDDDFGYDEVNHADWEIADGGSFLSVISFKSTKCDYETRLHQTVQSAQAACTSALRYSNRNPLSYRT